MLKLHNLIFILALFSCSSDEDFNPENPFGDTLLTNQPEGSKKEIIKETVICRTVVEGKKEVVLSGSLEGNREESYLHYNINLTEGVFKLSLSTPKRWNRRSIDLEYDYSFDGVKLSIGHAKSLIESELLYEDENLEVALEPLSDDSDFLTVVLNDKQANIKLELLFFELNGSNLFLYEARLSAKQLVSSHNERFTQSLRDIESPYEESEDEDAPLKTKEVCEKKVERKLLKRMLALI